MAEESKENCWNSSNLDEEATKAACYVEEMVQNDNRSEGDMIASLSEELAVYSNGTPVAIPSAGLYTEADYETTVLQGNINYSQIWILDLL